MNSVGNPQKLSPEFLQSLREKINLIDLVSEHVVLKKVGSNHSGLCPFHSERSPSFSVSETKQLYHCYGCKRGGDLFRFVMEMHGLDFPQAVEELAERAGVKLPKGAWNRRSPQAQQKNEKIETAYRLNRFTAAYFHQNLSSHQEALAYLSQRGVSESLQKLFYIGSSSSEWEGLTRFLTEKKAPLPLAEELGLIRKSIKAQKNQTHFDLFRNRVLFPILNLRGKVCGFGGRSLSEETPKYLNSPESILFKKSKLVFGLYQAQKHIRARDEVIIVEGYFDVMALHRAGFENTVATCGTSLTEEHLGLLSKLASRIIILFDADAAGLAATERAMELGLRMGKVLYGAFLPKSPGEKSGKDADEWLAEGFEKGRALLAQILSQPKPLLDLRIQEECQRARQSPEEKSQAIKRISGWLLQFNDPVGRAVRVQAVESELKISRSLLFAHAKTSPSQGIAKPTQVSSVSKVRRSQPLSKFDLNLLGIVLASGHSTEIAEKLIETGSKLPPSQTFSSCFESDSLRAWLFEEWRGGALNEIPQWARRRLLDLSELDPQWISHLTEAQLTFENRIQEQSVSLLSHGLTRAWARFSHELKQALMSAEAKKDAELHSKLLKEYLDVQRKMKEFIPSYDEA